MKRVALLGGESSGKTTLARALAQALGTLWVPEYGRQRWEELRTTLSIDELMRVARRQIEVEDEYALRATGWLVCDTTPLTTLQYCLHDHGQAPPALHQLARRSYDLTLVCVADFDFVQDGCRRDDTFRTGQQAWTLDRLAEQGVQPLLLRGGVALRLEHALEAMRSPPFNADSP
jgi:NadR type nicotinamide-nucleotide adenylyltransferase